MKNNSLIWDFIERADSRRSGVVVVKFPCGDQTISIGCTADVNNSSWPKVGPGELLFARPRQSHWTLGRPRQPCRLDCCLAAVFAAVRRTRIWHQHAHFFF